MSGLSNSTVSFLRLRKGKFFLSTDGENARGFTNLEAFLTGIEFKDVTHEDKTFRVCKLILEYEEEKYVLDLSVKSGYFSSFAMAIFNADITDLIELSAKSEKLEGKEGEKTSIFIKQDGESIKWYFTKDNPRDLPQWEKSEVDGKVTYDNSKQLAFLEEKLTGFVNRYSRNEKPKKESVPDQNIPVPQAIEEDDLPF